jgi:hypothetical protein
MTAETLDPVAPEAGAAPPVPLGPEPYTQTLVCRCGHERDAHEHYRPGDDCGVCGPSRCRRYARRTGRGARATFRR